MRIFQCQENRECSALIRWVLRGIICHISASMEAITRLMSAQTSSHQRDRLLSLLSSQLTHYPQSYMALAQRWDLLQNSDPQFSSVKLILGTVTGRGATTDGRELELWLFLLLSRLHLVKDGEATEEFFMFFKFSLISPASTAGGAAGVLGSNLVITHRTKLACSRVTW